MVLKVIDLQFDCSTWDDDGSNFRGMTGIMFDSAIEDTESRGITLHAVGKEEVELALNKELAEACGVHLDEIEMEIYNL